MIGAAIDAWRRAVPGTPKITKAHYYASRSELPSRLPRRTLAMVGGEPADPKWAIVACPCGSGHQIALPLRRKAGPTWSVTFDAVGRPTVWPSVDDRRDRRCHFGLRAGSVQWAPNRKLGRMATWPTEKQRRADDEPRRLPPASE